VSVRTIRVATRVPYDVHVGPGALERLPDVVLAERASAVLSDENVAPLHAARLGARARPLLAVPAGERSKSLGELERVLDFLAAQALDRSSVLIVLGGGVPGDLGGLAASLYQRGIALVQCPTTLLAQVDAAVGGKTAVNLAAG
jgi:3-dehydroquinate synthetase